MVVPRYGRVGGGERFVMALTEQLAAMGGLEMHVFANRWETRSDGVVFHKVPIISFPRFLRPLSFAYFSNRQISKAGMDLIHTHDRILEADLFTAHGLPHTTWIREVRRKRPSLFDLATAWTETRLITSNRCSRILPVSTLVEDKIVAAFPQSAEKIQVLTPGVDTTPYETLDRQKCRARVRQQFGIDQNDRVILFVGMNFEVKGLDAIICALARLKKIAPGMTVKLLVVGKGDEATYKKMAHHKGIEKEIIFTGVWKGEIAPVYLASDLFSMLSVYDTFGLTVLEAMAAGLPVIISHTVGARDIVQEGENGHIVTPAQTEEVSRRMANALDPATNNRMANLARKTAIAHSWHSMAKKVALIYKEIR